VVHTNPAKCRSELVELLQGQVSQGYGLPSLQPRLVRPEKRKAPQFKSLPSHPRPIRQSLIHGLADVCSDDALCWSSPCANMSRKPATSPLFDQVVPLRRHRSARTASVSERPLATEATAPQRNASVADGHSPAEATAPHGTASVSERPLRPPKPPSYHHLKTRA